MNLGSYARDPLLRLVLGSDIRSLSYFPDRIFAIQQNGSSKKKCREEYLDYLRQERNQNCDIYSATKSFLDDKLPEEANPKAEEEMLHAIQDELGLLITHLKLLTMENS